MIRKLLFPFSISLLCLLAPVTYGQTALGTINGRVLDSSGAAVPNVSVDVTNVATNLAVKVVTDGSGNYTAPFLNPGTYSVTVEASGFKKFVRSGLTLGVNQVMSVDVALEVGSTTEQVTVVAEAPLLETANADRGGVIDEKRVHELPINGRNPFMLGRLVAGVSFSGQAVWERPFDNGAIASWNINGSPNRTNEFLLDGAPNNAQAGGNNIALVPPVDSVQEFKIQTNSYDAQYGHTGGGIINVSLKSGTNALHGSGYEFLRREWMDAASFQNNAAGRPRDPHYLDQYGIQVGGPVILPKLYNGRSRSFFMVNYERYREGTPRPITVSVPPKEFLDGDFSKLVDAQGRRITIYNPFSGRDVNGTWTREAFPDNKIPTNMLNPIARKILTYHPAPNTTNPAASYGQDNYYFSGDAALDADSFYNLVVKIDHNFNDRHRMFFRHASNDRTQFGHDFSNVITGVGERGSLPHFRINDAYVIDWTSMLTPRTILNARGSYSRFTEGERGDNNVGFDMTTLGFPASLVSQLPGGPFFGLYNFTGYQSLGMYPNRNVTNNFNFHPTISVAWRGHTTKAGVDMRWIQYANLNTGDVFSLGGTVGFTQRDFARADALSGHSIASWLLGTPGSGSTQYNAFPINLYKYFAPWVQDDIRVSRKLTLNLGFRWDFNIPANERFDRLNRGFDTEVTNPVNAMINRAQFPTLPVLKGGLLFAGVNGVPRQAADTFKKAVQLRLGAAYEVSRKLVLRGGWGRYYINPNNNFIQTNGFTVNTPLINSLDDGRSPIPNLINNPFPQGVRLPPGASQGLLTFLGRNLNFVNPAFELPYVNQFSFGLQYELPMQSKIELTYAGSRGHDLQTSLGINNLDLNTRRQCNLAEGGAPAFCDQLVPNPFVGLAPFLETSRYSAATVARSSLTVPYPHFGSLTNNTRNDGATWYNSLQVQYETRQRGGLSLILAYTLSKMMEQTGWMDEQNLIPQRSLFDRDTPHRVSVASVWELPFGKGRKFLNTSHGFWSRVVSGWENSVIFQYQSGWPNALASNVLYVKDASLPSIDWSQPVVKGHATCAARWNDNGSITMVPASVAAGCTDYNFLVMPRFGPARYAPNRDGRIRLHTVPTADVALNKLTAITEKLRFQFRAEVFNIANTYMHNRQGFNTNPENAAFGTLTRATVSSTNSNLARSMQLGFKLLW
jgi:carboxypeptidase family protein